MTKISWLFVTIITFLFISCSSDDSGNVIQGPVAEKVLGKWYIKSIVEDGKDLNYTHKCADEKDYIRFDSQRRFSGTYNPDCTFNEETSVDYSINSNNNTIITNFFDPIITNQRTYKIIRLTDKELVLKTAYNDFSGEPEVNYVFSYTRQ